MAQFDIKASQLRVVADRELERAVAEELKLKNQQIQSLLSENTRLTKKIASLTKKDKPNET